MEREKKTYTPGILVQTTEMEPPVTKYSLSEFDIGQIISNVGFRYNLNFEPNSDLIPNLDGEEGRKKTENANSFWILMQKQLDDFLKDRELFEKDVGADWCLPVTLKAIRGILETLMPQDRQSVQETFNVELLMQQFRKEAADLVKLSSWLSKLLKRCCAPMRDTRVKEMVTQLSNGDRNCDVALLVTGVKNLLGVLEAMKYDVANEQLRRLRPGLIIDTVPFLQMFFLMEIAKGQVNIAGAHEWFKDATSSLPDHSTRESRLSQKNTWEFMKALVKLILPTTHECFPYTFLLDEERLNKLRLDMQVRINLEICMQYYRFLKHQSRHREIRHSDTPSSNPPTDSDSHVRSSLLSILSTSTSNEKGTSLSSSLALQILSSTTTSLTTLPVVEAKLEVYLTKTNEPCYQEAEERVLSELFPVLQRLVKTYTPYTSLQIFEAAISPKNGLRSMPLANSPKEEITEIATRMAHIGILHWRVWAPLAYLVDPDDESMS